MAAYAIVQVEITDPARFEEYKVQVPATIEKYGGKYLARGGAFAVLDGDWPTERTVILEFPTMDDAKRWYDSPEYAGPKALRKQAARVNIVVVEGIG